jgi:3-hydroxymyristoyl/3-hydroxydecanoyl-(acyl carrier protein) dehydratase
MYVVRCGCSNIDPKWCLPFPLVKVYNAVYAACGMRCVLELRFNAVPSMVKTQGEARADNRMAAENTLVFAMLTNAQR